MLEDFLNALSNFKRQKMRSLLSVLGVIIGVASVIVIMSMGQSSTRQIQSTFGSSGLDMVSVSGGFFRRSRDAVSIKFDEEFRKILFDSIEGIKKVWYKNNLSATISFGTLSASASCFAIEYGYLQSYGLSLEEGEFFSVTDEAAGNQKIILGSEIASSLFPNGDAVGKFVLLFASGVPFNFKVSGVLKEQSSGMEDAATSCYIPRGFFVRKITPNPAAENVMVQATSRERAGSLSQDIMDFSSKLSGTEGSVYAFSMQTMIEQMSQINQTLSVMLSAIAAISLLVGGIGIMNIMLVTVTERREEIGIRKALGAAPNVIRRQFLIEASAITVMGGIAGIFFGVLVSLAVEYVRSLEFCVSVKSCFVSFLFSVFVGIFFGFSPASRAAKLDPVLALSGE